MEAAGWRDFDSCVKMEEYNARDYYGSFMTRALGVGASSLVTLLQIFLFFINPGVISSLLAQYPSGLYLGSRGSGQSRMLRVNERYLLQALAVYLFITAKHETTTQVTSADKFLEGKIRDAIGEMHKLTPGHEATEILGFKNVCQIIARYLITPKITKNICANFCAFLFSPGQDVALDEKLDYYTGKDNLNVRQVLTKKARIGLWFYELCCRVKCTFTGGSKTLPFLMYVHMHDGYQGERLSMVTVLMWCVVALWSIGANGVHPKDNPWPLTFIAMDSYYMSRAVVTYLVSIGQKFTASMNKSRFKMELEYLHRRGGTSKPGDYKSIYNSLTGELITWCFDKVESVGEKWNYSFGFKPLDKNKKSEKADYKMYQNIVPGYHWYKLFFSICDRFNYMLIDKSWPHKRGGHGKSGFEGTYHDFVMSCVFVNTRNAYLSIKGLDPSSIDFYTMMSHLAVDILKYSYTLKKPEHYGYYKSN